MSKLVTSTGIPASWELVPLKELGNWAGGGTPSKAKPQYWQGGTIPWVSPKDMKTERISDSEDHITKEAISHSTASLIKAGSVLIVTRSGILRHTLPVAVSSVAVTVNQDLKALTPRNGIMAKYVAWALRAFARDILNTCSKQGTTVNSVETVKLLRFEIPVAPTEQQHTIVAEIEKQFSRLDEAVANLKRVKANLKRYKASVLKAAVEGKLTEDWRKQHPNVEPASELLEYILAERRCRWEEDQLSKFKDKAQEMPKNWKAKYKVPVAPHSTDFPPLPKEWCWATLDQTLWNLRSGTAETSRRESTDYPVLKSSAVRQGVIDFKDLNYLQKSQSLRRENFLRRGDFLITRLSGSLDYVGCSAVVRDIACEGIQYPDRIFCGKLITGTDGIYLSYCFQHSGIRKALEEAAKSTAGHQRISMSDLYPLTLPLPPVAEQQRIVAEVERHLSVIDQLEAAIEANLTRAARLRHSILSQAFTGQLVGREGCEDLC